jgi:hypothetical protein
MILFAWGKRQPTSKATLGSVLPISMAWPDLTTIGVIVSIVASIGALALGIWTRVEQWREYRTRRSARKPHFDMIASPSADNSGQFVFYNPGEHAFSVGKIEVTTAGIELAPVQDPGVGAVGYSGLGTAPDISRAGKSIVVGWTVEAGASRSPAHRLFWRPISDPMTFSIRVTAREISATRRKFHMQAEAIVNTAAP